MKDLGQAAASSVTRREEQDRLIGFAEQIARKWAATLAISLDAVEWVAVKGGGRTPITGALSGTVIHQLENDAGIAFVLGTPGVMDLLFVVSRRRNGYSVCISNNTRPADRSERIVVRPDYVGDMIYLMAAAKRYVRKVAA